MKPILQALGYFGLFVAVYVVTTLVAVVLMGFAGVAVVTGVFLGTGALTVALSIIAAVMSYHHYEYAKEVETEQIKTDHNYRMELLRIAEDEKNGLEKEALELQMGPPNHRHHSTVQYP